MNIGPFALPAAPLILFLGLVAAVLTCRLFGAKRKETESAIFTSLLVGLAFARISFVLHYLPAYGGSLMKMLDFRDQGFDASTGLVAGIVVAVFIAIRRAAIRRSLLAAATVGLVAWGTAGAVTRHFDHPTQLPSISL